jgi:uncharacterized protein (DUF1501 family)
MSAFYSRRQFVQLGASTFATYGMLNTLGGMRSALAATTDTSGYKAIVCVFLYGGNSSFNWVVPITSAGHSTYAKNRSNLTIAQNSLLPLNGTASDGYSYGFHPSCPELRTLFNQEHLAVLCNVGTLVQPVTPAQAQAGSVALPSQLFSHIDQQTSWMTSIADSTERYGWAGRIADLMTSQGSSARLAFNINVGGANYWQEGKNSNPYVLGTSGAPTWDVTGNVYYRSGLRGQAAQALVNQAATDASPLVSQYAAIQNNAAAKVTLVNNALSAAGDLATPFPSYTGDSGLGSQLHEVARCIKARSQIGDSRQMFFVMLNGFDTHNAELATQQNLLRILSQNLQSFWTALGEISMQNNVTLFTASDFGRSVGSNGDGSDHAWGGHSIVMGGAVDGGKYYGKMPNLTIGGPNDFGSGRIVPTTSSDQYAATLSRWFGVPDADLNSVFPNLQNFATRNLGFLG